MAHLTDLDLTTPADSLYSGGGVLNTWRARIDVLNDALGDITTAEANQVENLGTTTVSAAQWGYLGACTAAGGAILDDADASAQRTTLGLVIGTNVQAYDAGLANLAGIAMAVDKFYYTSADNTHVAASVTSFARSILDDADEATFKATVNLEIGTDVLAQQTVGIADNNLVEIDHAAVADDDYAKFTTAGLEGRSYSEVKTDLSLNNVENTAISGWAGSGNITTIGTVTSGILSTGAVLADVTMTLGSDADGDIYYRASNVLTRLAKGTEDYVLTMGADVPEWAVAAGGNGGLSNIVEDTTPQLGGELDCQAHTIGFTQQTATGDDGTTTIDWKLGNKFYFTFGAQNETFTFTAPTHECNLLLVLKQDANGGGSRTAAWPDTVMWPGGTAPTLSTGANDVDIISFYWDGANYHGSSLLDFSVPA